MSPGGGEASACSASPRVSIESEPKEDAHGDCGRHDDRRRDRESPEDVEPRLVDCEQVAERVEFKLEPGYLGEEPEDDSGDREHEQHAHGEAHRASLGRARAAGAAPPRTADVVPG